MCQGGTKKGMLASLTFSDRLHSFVPHISCITQDDSPLMETRLIEDGSEGGVKEIK